MMLRSFAEWQIVKAALAAVLLLVAANAEASEKALRSFFTDVDTLQAVFVQKVVDETGMILEESSGVFSLSRPGKFRWDYKSTDPDVPEGQQIIADGESLFFYDPDLEQVSKRSLDAAFDQVPSLLLVQSSADVDQHFLITDFDLTDGLGWVALKPKSPDASYQQLMIGFDGKELNTLVLVDGLGNETRLEMSGVRTNGEIANSVFEFEPPAGADVLSE